MQEKLRFLESSRSVGNGTSLVTLYIPGRTKVGDMTSFVTTELSKAPNIKSRITRQNVLEALKSISYILKGYNRFPEEGLAIFSGTTLTDKVTEVILPKQPIMRFLYRCDTSFCV
jgi:peptide chain release factor subunit 1